MSAALWRGLNWLNRASGNCTYAPRVIDATGGLCIRLNQLGSELNQGSTHGLRFARERGLNKLEGILLDPPLMSCWATHPIMQPQNYWF